MLTQTTLLPLHRADGSAVYSCNEFSVLAAINGPVEVQRRDELPEEAAIDVVVRPASGVGGVRERHLESIILKTLRHVILVSAYPRKLIQVTLQVTGMPDNASSTTKLPQATTHLPVLPALLQASMLALLSTCIPLAMIYTSALLAVDLNGTIIYEPSLKQIDTASSLHVLSISSNDRILVSESEGAFDLGTWESVVEEGKRICRGSTNTRDEKDDVSMDSDENDDLASMLRKVVGGKVAKDHKWKEGIK